MRKDDKIQVRMTSVEKKGFEKTAKAKGFKTMTDYVYWLLRNAPKVVIVISVVMLTAGCATIFKQKERVVSFETEPQGAAIYIDGNRMGKTPLPIKLSNKKTVTVTFRKEGYEDKTYIINTHVGCGWVVLDVLGGFIPIIIDAVSGNWDNLETTSIKGLLDIKEVAPSVSPKT